MTFPEDFIWGAATSAYQIEGAARQDGRGDSIWDVYCRQPDAIWNGHSGDTACDHYHRMSEDVALMRALGLQAYRFSVAWPRVLPQGVGAVNAAGLDFYDRLVDALLAAEIAPFLTLYHWDLPQALEARGGWLNRDCAAWFAEYAGIVAARLGDRVRHWITLNEPAVFIVVGYGYGSHAPGRRCAVRDLLAATHHGLLAHGGAVQALRQHAPGAQVGIAPDTVVPIPASDDPATVAAARQQMFAVTEAGLPTLQNAKLWLDPVVFGSYPDDALAVFADVLPDIRPGDMALISQPVDFIGINIYRGQRTDGDAATPGGRMPTSPPITTAGWEVTPEALRWGPLFLWERYRLPVYIAENGLANADWVALDGGVHDPQRIDFTHRYLLQLDRALDAGADVRGYFHWSLLDNFEWTAGMRYRFGLVYVDFDTQQRILKDSARWYRAVIASHGASLYGGARIPKKLRVTTD